MASPAVCPVLTVRRSATPLTTTKTSPVPRSTSQESRASRGTCSTAPRLPVSTRPLTKSPPRSEPSSLRTSAVRRTERLAASTVGLMNITAPVKLRPGTPSVVNSSGCPTRSSLSRLEGTLTVTWRTRLSTTVNIGPPPMFSTRSPGLTPRIATTPSIGARMIALARRVSARSSWDFATAVVAAAASRAERASSSACCVISPYSLSFSARSSSRWARDSATWAWSTAARAPSTTVRPSEVSSRASGVPLLTRTHSVT